MSRSYPSGMKEKAIQLLHLGYSKVATMELIRKEFNQQPTLSSINRWILDDAKAMCSPKL